MAKHDPNRHAMNKLSKYKILLILGYASIIIVSIMIVSTLSVQKTDKVLKNKVSTIASSLNVQMKLNLDSYLEKMETVGALAFASEEVYNYDATDPNNDEYEALNTEKIISDKLYSLCIMENFIDYGIVYSNNRTVGKISNGTSNLFGNRIFTDLYSKITHPRTHDGWFTGYKDDFKRIYYVKKIHNNALLVISFYTSELETVFDNPEAMDDMDIRLINSNYNIIYSSVSGEVGLRLSTDLSDRVDSLDSSTIIDDDYLVSVNSCSDDWYVISSVPTKIILNEKNEVRLYIYMIAFLAAVFSILVGIELAIRLTNPVSSFFSTLTAKAQIDQLTGILNKRAFEDCCEHSLKHASYTESHALIILDIDNFKGINDSLGHAFGDKSLAKIGSILRSTFSSEDFLGRIGGDEFCVYLNHAPDSSLSYLNYVRNKCDEVCDALHKAFADDDSKLRLSASIGIALFPSDGQSFQDLYAASDKALYLSKRRGKDNYTFYNDSALSEAVDL